MTCSLSTQTIIEPPAAAADKGDPETFQASATCSDAFQCCLAFFDRLCGVHQQQAEQQAEAEESGKENKQEGSSQADRHKEKRGTSDHEGAQEAMRQAHGLEGDTQAGHSRHRLQNANKAHPSSGWHQSVVQAL